MGLDWSRALLSFWHGGEGLLGQGRHPQHLRQHPAGSHSSKKMCALAAGSVWAGRLRLGGCPGQEFHVAGENPGSQRSIATWLGWGPRD